MDIQDIIYTHIHAHARMRALLTRHTHHIDRTHTHTHTRTHIRTHIRTHHIRPHDQRISTSRARVHGTTGAY